MCHQMADPIAKVFKWNAWAKTRAHKQQQKFNKINFDAVIFEACHHTENIIIFISFPLWADATHSQLGQRIESNWAMCKLCHARFKWDAWTNFHFVSCCLFFLLLFGVHSSKWGTLCAAKRTIQISEMAKKLNAYARAHRKSWFVRVF